MVTDTTPDDVTERIDVTGESCPMPVVRTKQAIDDIDGWAGSLDTFSLLAQTESTQDGETVYHHFVERVDE